MKLVLKTKLLVRRHFCGHAHERSRMWIDHLFCNEQSSHTRSDIFCFVTHPSAAPVVTVSCASRQTLGCAGGLVMGGPWSPKILYPEWQNKYQVALLELDRKKLLERVTAAETAIFNRIQAISPEHAAERQAIENALANLRLIRRGNPGLPAKPKILRQPPGA